MRSSRLPQHTHQIEVLSELCLAVCGNVQNRIRHLGDKLDVRVVGGQDYITLLIEWSLHWWRLLRRFSDTIAQEDCLYRIVRQYAEQMNRKPLDGLRAILENLYESALRASDAIDFDCLAAQLF
jgi:hypothetical protein